MECYVNILTTQRNNICYAQTVLQVDAISIKTHRTRTAHAWVPV